jgi:SpoIID/LytB domain protein
MEGRMRRAAAGVVAAMVVAAGLVLTTVGPASAAEVYLRPASGSFTLDGRGYGHGIGMSQYGAKGAAEAGLTWQQVMAFYYPGTAIGNNGNPTLRVRLGGVTHLAVVAQTGLRANLDRTNAASAWQTLPATITRSGTTYTVDQWDVAYFTDTTTPANTGWWLRASVVGSSSFLNYAKTAATATTVAFDNPSTLTVRRGTPTAYSTYRGELRHVRSANTSSATVTVVDALPMESYLRGVVPNEMPASWSTEAVRSQAVAARTYAEYERRHASSGAVYDTCDSTACQVFKPVETEQPQSDSAITATAGKIVTYQGAAAFTQFSASNGGYSVKGSQPYLTAHPDRYDTFTWTATVAATSIEQAWPAIGRFSSMSLTRDGLGPWGGRITSVDLRGSAGTVTVTGSTFSNAMGLKHNLFKPRAALVSQPSFPSDTTGDRVADVVAVVNATGELRVYPGTGQGAFGRPVSAGTGWGGYAQVLTGGTWDQGAVADVVSVGSDGTLSWYRGRGNGTFDPGVQIGTGYDGYDLLTPIGDFSGDGGTDLLGRRTDGTLWLVQGNGQGQVLDQVQVGTGWSGFTAIFSPGDFSGDGLPDVLARDSSGNLWMYAGAGGGKFHSRVQVGKGWGGFTSLSSPGDFSGDRKADVIARGSDGRLWLYRGAGAGRFGTKSVIGTGWNSVTILH